MKTISYERYGSPDVLDFRDAETPAVGENQVLVQVHAAAVNPLDWHALRGVPYIMRLETGIRAPKSTKLGADVAGTVERVGANVTDLQPGDEVFGECRGAFAEFALASPTKLARKPAGLSFEHAAAIPVAGVTALQALRERGHLAPGGSVLINGAAGGVGTFAVQLAKWLGATATGVCSTRNVELVTSLGADHAIDYTEENFIQRDARYDLIIDLVGNHSLRSLRRVLTREGTLVVCSGGDPRPSVLGPLWRIAGAKALSSVVRQKMPFFLATPTSENLHELAKLIEDETITPVIDRMYPLSATADALRYLELGHARGKVIITV